MKHSPYTISNSSSLIPSRKALAICSFQPMPASTGRADHTSHMGRACPAFVRCPTPEARDFCMRHFISQVRPTDSTSDAYPYAPYGVYLPTPEARWQTQIHTVSLGGPPGLPYRWEISRILGEVGLRYLLDVGTTNVPHPIRLHERCGEKLSCKNSAKLAWLTEFTEWVRGDLVECDSSGIDGSGKLLLAHTIGVH